MAAREADVLFEARDAEYDFYVVIGGEVVVVDQLYYEPRLLAIHREGEFVGNLALQSGGIASQRR